MKRENKEMGAILFWLPKKDRHLFRLELMKENENVSNFFKKIVAEKIKSVKNI